MDNKMVLANQKDIVREGAFDLTPRSLSEALQLAEMMSKSDLVPEQFRNKPGDVLIAVQYGAEVGLAPLQSLSSIAVINGRATIWGDGALGLVLNSGLMENYKEMTIEEIEAAKKAVFWGKRKGVAEPIIREFSYEDAKRAKLLNKTIYISYWPRMLQMRARSWGLRDGWADVLKGIAIREEVDDYEVVEAPKVLAMPRRLSETKAVAQSFPESLPAEEQPPSDEDGQAEQPQVDQAAFDEAMGSSESSYQAPDKCGKCGAALTYHEDGKWGPWWSCSKYRESGCDYKISKKKWDKDTDQ